LGFNQGTFFLVRFNRILEGCGFFRMRNGDLMGGDHMGKEEISPSWKLMQVGLVVRDMDKAIKRFSALGFGPFSPKSLPPGTKVWVTEKPSDGEVDVRATMVEDMELELCQPVSGPSPHKDFLESKGEGIQHIMFAVDDLEKEIERLTEQGAKVLLGASFGNGGGLAYLDLDACGLIVELIQIPKNGMIEVDTR
jgi:methylmalonyl-CoA/ethylmalonyl-CoA epimerase